MTSRRVLHFFDRLNPLMIGCLHAPVLHHLLSAGLMTISYEGRRSGRSIRFPVGYDDQGDAILVLSSDAANRNWWRNFETPWPASLRIRGKSRPVLGQLLSAETAEYRERVGRSFARASFIPRMFDVDYDPARGLSDDQLRKVADYAAVVRFVSA